jgi:2-polyprenyl-6-methoxyphenol hydroxylase-like FAD-dependent oxidoreductase
VPLNVIIVGAGLGGLAAAIALARNKHNVTIYEQAERIAEVHSVIAVTSTQKLTQFTGWRRYSDSSKFDSATIQPGAGTLSQEIRYRAR